MKEYWDLSQQVSESDKKVIALWEKLLWDAFKNDSIPDFEDFMPLKSLSKDEFAAESYGIHDDPPFKDHLQVCVDRCRETGQIARVLDQAVTGEFSLFAANPAKLLVNDPGGPVFGIGPVFRRQL